MLIFEPLKFKNTTLQTGPTDVKFNKILGTGRSVFILKICCPLINSFQTCCTCCKFSSSPSKSKNLIKQKTCVLKANLKYSPVNSTEMSDKTQLHLSTQ